jgi:dolichol-phosphate mannosyltransferase
MAPPEVAGRNHRAQGMDLSVVIPTYCESENLEPLVSRLHPAIERAGIWEEIIVVDDNSPDRTADVCQKLALSYPLRLILREKKDCLSSAVVHGIQQARGEIVVVMDADLSHPPEAVPELYHAVKSQGADFVIGSRYIPGGRIEKGWSFFRRLGSFLATLPARPLTSAKDPLAGFFALRRSTFEAARDIDPIGYKIGLELMVKCGCRRVLEIPITFRDRLHGESKMGLGVLWNYFRHLRRLYGYKLRRIFKRDRPRD